MQVLLVAAPVVQVRNRQPVVQVRNRLHAVQPRNRQHVVQPRSHQHVVQPRSQTSKLIVFGVLGDNDYQVKRLSYKSLAPITPLTPNT